MISNPKIGRVVQVWYAEPRASGMPHHGRVGIVTVASKARKCRNHQVRFGGPDDAAAVPAGNLRDPVEFGTIMDLSKRLLASGMNPVAMHWSGANIGSGTIVIGGTG